MGPLSSSRYVSPYPARSCTQTHLLREIGRARDVPAKLSTPTRTHPLQDYALEKLPSIIAQFGPSVVPDLMEKAKALFPRLDIEGKILLANSIRDIASKVCARSTPSTYALGVDLYMVDVH